MSSLRTSWTTKCTALIFLAERGCILDNDDMHESEIPYDRLVGIPSVEKDATDAVHEHISALRIRHNETMLPGEIEPTAHDIEIMTQAWNRAMDYLRSYGREIQREFDLSAIHIFPPGGTAAYQPRLTGGAHSTAFSSILADRNDSDVQFSLVLFHEMLHLLEHNALQITVPNEKGESSIEPYRTGFSVTSRDGKEHYFDVFDEAVVGLITKRYFEEVLSQDPQYQEEIAREIDIDTSRIPEGEELQELAVDIYEDNREQFANAQEITDLFIRCSVGGNFLPIARLIEKTYGKGSFRELGEASSYENWHKKNF